MVIYFITNMYEYLTISDNISRYLQITCRYKYSDDNYSIFFMQKDVHLGENSSVDSTGTLCKNVKFLDFVCDPSQYTGTPISALPKNYDIYTTGAHVYQESSPVYLSNGWCA